MSDLEQARALLIQARKDFQAVQNMTDPGNFDDAIFGFHVQQAVEKALKAWLAALDREYPYRHDLGELLEALRQAGQDVTPFENLVSFTAFAVQFRYEEYELSGLPGTRQEAIRDVERLLGKVTEVVGS